MVTIRIEKNSPTLQKLGLKKYTVVVREGKQGSPVKESHPASNKVAATRIQSSLKQQYRSKRARRGRAQRCR